MWRKDSCLGTLEGQEKVPDAGTGGRARQVKEQPWGGETQFLQDQREEGREGKRRVKEEEEGREAE